MPVEPEPEITLQAPSQTGVAVSWGLSWAPSRVSVAAKPSPESAVTSMSLPLAAGVVPSGATPK